MTKPDRAFVKGWSKLGAANSCPMRRSKLSGNGTVYTQRARSDLQSILRYIDERNPRGARNVKRAIQKTIELIGEFPEGGRLAGEQGARVLPTVYWHVIAGEVWLLHIRDGRRRPWQP